MDTNSREYADVNCVTSNKCGQDFLTVAIDGPSGAGKSTIAKLLAKKLHIAYLDTGAMYRTVALFLTRRGIEPDDGIKIAQLLNAIEIDIISDEDKGQVVLLNGENVTQAIRENAISDKASAFSAVAIVRHKLVAMQQEIATHQPCVLDGRDIGTVVLPKAKYKFFLTASVESRAKRRFDELIARGQNVVQEQIEKEIKERDNRDITRTVSPLRQAADSILIDSTNLTVEQVLVVMSSFINE